MPSLKEMGSALSEFCKVVFGVSNCKFTKLQQEELKNGWFEIKFWIKPEGGILPKFYFSNHDDFMKWPKDVSIKDFKKESIDMPHTESCLANNFQICACGEYHFADFPAKDMTIKDITISEKK